MYLLLLLLWIVFNGKFTVEIFLIGLVVSALVYALCWKFFGYSPKRDLHILKNTGLIIVYIAVLIKEIFIANFFVVKMILTKYKVHPVLVHFNSGLESSTAKFVLSHSITLTPGTITVELNGSDFSVHCLDESLSNGLENSEFIKLLKKMEK